MASNRPPYLPSIGRLLGFASASCTLVSDRRLAEYDLTVRQWVLLTAVWRSSPATESELAKYTRMSLSAQHKLIDRMEAKGFVVRSNDVDDGRKVVINAGPKAKKLAHLLDFYKEINDVALKGFKASERDTLFALLQRVVDNLEEDLDES